MPLHFLSTFPDDPLGYWNMWSISVPYSNDLKVKVRCPLGYCVAVDELIHRLSG